MSSKNQEEEKKRTLDKRTPAQLAYEKMQEKRVGGKRLSKGVAVARQNPGGME